MFRTGGCVQDWWVQNWSLLSEFYPCAVFHPVPPPLFFHPISLFPSSSTHPFPLSPSLPPSPEHSLYVSLCPRDFRKASHSSDHHSWGDTEDSDAVDGEEEEEGGGGEDNLPTPCNSAKTLKLEDLHEDSELLAPPLNTRVSSRGKSADTELDGDQDASLSNTLSAQTSAVAYTSEPNLAVLGIRRDKATPSYPTPSSPSKQVPEGPIYPTMSLNVTTPPTSSRTQHLHHGLAMTAPAGGLQYEYKVERGRGAVGLRKSATMEKKPRRGGGVRDLTTSLNASAQHVDPSGAQAAATTEVGGATVVGKHRKGFKEHFLSKLNKMRGKKEGKTTSSVPDILVPPGGQSKARRNSILKRYPSSASGVTESLGGGVALQATESPFPSSGRTGSFSSSVGGASQYSTLVSKIFSVLNCWQEWHYEVSPLALVPPLPSFPPSRVGSLYYNYVHVRGQYLLCVCGGGCMCDNH